MHESAFADEYQSAVAAFQLFLLRMRGTSHPLVKEGTIAAQLKCFTKVAIACMKWTMASRGFNCLFPDSGFKELDVPCMKGLDWTVNDEDGLKDYEQKVGDVVKKTKQLVDMLKDAVSNFAKAVAAEKKEEEKTEKNRPTTAETSCTECSLHFTQ